MAYVAGELTVGLYAEMVQFQRDMQAASMSLGRLAQEAQAAQSKVSTLDRSLKTAAFAAGAMIASTAVLAKRSFMAAASVAEMDTAMGAIEESSGLAEGSLRDAADAIRAKGIEMRSAQEIAVLFAKAEIDLADATKVARAAQDLAVISQSNSTATAMRLTYAIQTGNSQLLRSVGIQKYASEAYEDYAESIGKATTHLTQQERQQALTNMVLEEAAKVAGAYEAAMLEPGKVLRSFPRLLNDMQIAFGDVLLEGFGPVIKASYDFTKQVSLAVREGGYFAPLLNEMQEAVTALVAPLSKFLYGLTDSMKALNEGKISVDGFAQSLEKFAPVILGAATALSAFAGGSILALVPGLRNITALVGLRSPLILGFIALTSTSHELRDTVKKLVTAMLPLVEVAASLSEVVAEQLIVAAEAFVPILISTIEVVASLISALAQFAEFATRSAEVTKVLAAAMLVLYARSKLMKAEIGVGLVGSMKSFTAGVKENIRYQKALATQAGVSATSFQLFGAAAVTSFRAAAVAAKAFIASLLPLAAITAAVWGISKAMEYFANRGKDARERTEELVPVIEDLTQAFLDGELAAEGFASGIDVVVAALTAEGSEETNKFIDSLNDLGVAHDDVGQQMLAFESNFDKAATALLRQKGYSDDVVESMLAVVNATDDNGDALRDHAARMKFHNLITAELNEEQLQLLAVLEEIQDQTENLDGPTIAAEGLLQLRRSGDLSLEAFGRFKQEIADGEDPLAVYARAIDSVRLAQSAGSYEAARYRDHLFMVRQGVEEVVDEIAPLISDSYVLERALRDIGDAAAGVNDELASVEKETKTLTKSTDKFVDVLVGVEKSLLEAGMSSEEVTAAQQLLAANFYATAAAAGATDPELQKLRDTLVILDGLDPQIDISMGLDAGELRRQLRQAEAVLTAMADGVAQVPPAQRAAQEALIGQLRVLTAVADAFGSSNSAVGKGVRKTGDEFDKAAGSASRLANELDDVADAYREIVQELLSVDFALTNSEVLLEELRDRALEVAKAFDQMSDAKRLQEFHGQVQQILSMMRDLAASGASMGEIDNFVEQLIGPNGALAVFAKSAGISAEDFAKAVAAIEGFQFQIGQEQQFAAATAGMTPEEVEQFSKYLLGLEASGAIPSQDFSTATVSSGSTTINVNLPPGVSGTDVVNALQDYAQTSGASIQAPFEFVNLG